MTQVVDAAELDFRQIVRDDDQILWGQACGEPLTLTEALVAQRAAIGPVSVFLGSGFSKTLQPEHADHLRMTGIGGIGTHRRLTAAGKLAVVPCHVGQIAGYIRDGQIRCDVVFVQVARTANPDELSFGAVNDYVQEAINKARVVVAEVNDRAPDTRCDRLLSRSRIHWLINTSRPLVAVAPASVGEVERAIAHHASAFIGDGATLQIGVGAIPDAIAQLLVDRRNLGVHSGMLGDSVVDLMQSGAVNNSLKPIDAGVTVTGMLIGSQRLFDYAHRNDSIVLHSSHYTHGETILARLPNLISVNTALEVDLSGQSNAEQTGDDYVGGVGGQADYVRAGNRSAGGHSILALPATALKGTVSRICAALSGPVTNTRAEADIIVTEFGAAQLRGQSIPERARRLIAIAHPDFRDTLAGQVAKVLRRGY